MFGAFDIFSEFSDEQYTRANISLLIKYLEEKNIINSEEFWKYYENNIKDMLEEVEEIDRKEREKAIKEFEEKYKNKGD